MALFVRFLQFARRYRWPVLMSIVLVFVSQGLMMPLPWVGGILTDKVVTYLGLTPEQQPTGQAETLKYLWMICALLLGAQILNGIVTYIRSQMLIYVGNRVVFDIRQRLFRHVNRLSMRYFESHSHGQIMARILYDVDAVQSVLSGGVVDMITNVVTVIVVVVVLYVMDWRLATICSCIPLSTQPDSNWTSGLRAQGRI